MQLGQWSIIFLQHHHHDQLSSYFMFVDCASWGWCDAGDEFLDVIIRLCGRRYSLLLSIRICLFLLFPFAILIKRLIAWFAVAGTVSGLHGCYPLFGFCLFRFMTPVPSMRLAEAFLPLPWPLYLLPGHCGGNSLPILATVWHFSPIFGACVASPIRSSS